MVLDNDKKKSKKKKMVYKLKYCGEFLWVVYYLIYNCIKKKKIRINIIKSIHSHLFYIKKERNFCKINWENKI